MKSEKPFKILVTEDREKHIADAKAYFAPFEQKGIVHADYATTFRDAERILYEAELDGIISDVFFPFGEIQEAKRLKNELMSLMRGEVEPDSPPSGVLIAQLAKGRSIPIVFNTDTHHHMLYTEPVSQWANKQGIQLVETGDGDDLGKSKDWEAAYWIIAAETETRSYPKKVIPCRNDITSKLELYFAESTWSKNELEESGTLKQNILEKYGIVERGDK